MSRRRSVRPRIPSLLRRLERVHLARTPISQMSDPESLTPVPQPPPRAPAPAPVVAAPVAPDLPLQVPRTTTKSVQLMATQSIAAITPRPPAMRTPPAAMKVPSIVAPVAQPEPPPEPIAAAAPRAPDLAHAPAAPRATNLPHAPATPRT